MQSPTYKQLRDNLVKYAKNNKIHLEDAYNVAKEYGHLCAGLGSPNWEGSGELVRKIVTHEETTLYLDYNDEQIILDVPHDFDDAFKIGDRLRISIRVQHI